MASFYPFSQTPFFAEHLAGWPWTQLVGGGMIVLGGLMLSHVIYPPVPRLSVRTPKGRAASAFVAACVALLIWNPRLVLFPAALTYLAVGVIRTVAMGLLDRLPERDLLSEELAAQDEETESRELEYENMRPHWSSRSQPAEPDEGSELDDYGDDS